MNKLFKAIKYIYRAIKVMLPIYIILMIILAIMIYIIPQYLSKCLESNIPLSWTFIPTTMLATVYTIKTYSNWEIFQLKKELTQENIINNRKNLIIDYLYLIIYTTASITIALFKICQYKNRLPDNITLSVWAAIASIIYFALINFIIYLQLPKQVD